MITNSLHNIEIVGDYVSILQLAKYQNVSLVWYDQIKQELSTFHIRMERVDGPRRVGVPVLQKWICSYCKHCRFEHPKVPVIPCLCGASAWILENPSI